jgi:uncharacterized coiled-coil DUF342 family protein
MFEKCSELIEEVQNGHKKISKHFYALRNVCDVWNVMNNELSDFTQTMNSAKHTFDPLNSSQKALETKGSNEGKPESERGSEDSVFRSTYRAEKGMTNEDFNIEVDHFRGSHDQLLEHSLNLDFSVYRDWIQTKCSRR